MILLFFMKSEDGLNCETGSSFRGGKVGAKLVQKVGWMENGKKL
jgi:hypothetical protein